MKIRITCIFACLVFTAVVNGADTHVTPLLSDASETTRLLSRPTNASSDPSSAVGTAQSAALNGQTVIEVHAILNKDYVNNVKDISQTRWFFRKAAGCSDVLSDIFSSIGKGLTILSGSMRLIGSQELSNEIIFAATGCFAMHIALFGIAKCSKKQADERQQQLGDLGEEVGFKVVPLKSTIVEDDASSPVPTRTAGSA